MLAIDAAMLSYGIVRLAARQRLRRMESYMNVIDFEPVNNVELRGRVSSEPIEHELPSGDVVLEFRLVVPRTDRSGVDTLDLAVWKVALRRRARNLSIGNVIEVRGTLRRRFWQGATGVASRSQVEVEQFSKMT